MSAESSRLKWWNRSRHRGKDPDGQKSVVAETSSAANGARAIAIRSKGAVPSLEIESTGEETLGRAVDAEKHPAVEPFIKASGSDTLKNLQEPGLHVIFNSMSHDGHVEIAELDVVAVHGLNFKGNADHARDTWTKGDKLWLRDFLPERLGRPSRVMLFAYNASPAIGASAINFDDHARSLLQWLHLKREETPRRPLIFICHSLGGLVVKQALVEAALDPSYKSILEAARLVVFFATPHQGGNHVSVGAVVAKLARAALLTPRNDLLEALKQNSDATTKRFEQSRHLPDSFFIISFFEGQPYGKTGILVDKRSATLNLPGSHERQVVIDADHSAICKFDSVDSSVCQLVLNTIAAEVKRAFEVPLGSQGLGPETSPQPSVLMPFCRDPDFVHRGDLLDQIDQTCLQPPHRVAVVGLGGVGKSQLAIEFAYRIRERSTATSVFWVHAGTRTRVEEGFRAIAEAVKLAGRDKPKANIPQLLYQWLSNERNGRWLMVLDNADDQDVFFGTFEGEQDQRLATYLPQSPNGCILVTTRDKHLADRLAGKRSNSIEVGPMTKTEALTLLRTKLGSDTRWDEEAADDLIQVLDLVPLAVSQAAAYIQARAPRSSLRKYLEEFRQSESTKTRLLMQDVGDLRRDGGASNAVLTTWRISFDHILFKRPSAADLLALMSFFDRQGIPEWVLKGEGLSDDTPGARNTTSAKSGPDEESDGVEGSLGDQFEDDLAMLRDYCLVTVNEGGDEFKMHSLVQLSMRKWLEVSGQQEKFQQRYVKQMAAAFPTGHYENWKICGTLFAHAQAALNYPPKDGGLQEWGTLLHNGGRYAWLQGRYDIAERMLSKAQKAREKRLGKDDMGTINSTSLFALVIKDRGRWDEAERLFVEVLEMTKTKLGADHPDTLTSMSNLASTYSIQGRWDEAERLEVEAIEMTKTKLGADHPDTLSSMNNLASIYGNQGRWDEAERLQVEVKEMIKTKLGADHPDTLSSMNNLASTYGNQGRWDEAEGLQAEVIEARKTKLGADHPDTLVSISNQGCTFGEQGRWDEAERLFMEVMESRKAKLGADHPDTLTSMNNLAITWKILGRHTDAVALMKNCVGARQRVLGQSHPRTLSSIAMLDKWNR